MSRQHLSCRHLSISGTSQLFVTLFWPNFNAMFLGSSLKDSNCHGDICSGNICPNEMCSYYHNLSCYWPNFHETFGTQFFGPMNFFVPKIFWIKMFLLPKTLLGHIFYTQNFLDPNIFWIQNFLDPNLFGLDFFTLTFFWKNNKNNNNNHNHNHNFSGFWHNGN